LILLISLAKPYTIIIKLSVLGRSSIKTSP